MLGRRNDWPVGDGAYGNWGAPPGEWAWWTWCGWWWCGSPLSPGPGRFAKSARYASSAATLLPPPLLLLLLLLLAALLALFVFAPVLLVLVALVGPAADVGG